ncbi:hypothetical protein QSG27_29040, partial [Azospirillum sp. C340-1]|nr:hypothetical protein [Azospirillum isscasi]
LGFSLSEGIVADAEELESLRVVEGCGGGDVRWGWVDLVMRLRAVEAASGGSLGAFALAAALEAPFADLLLELVGALKEEPPPPGPWLHAMRLLAAMDLDAAAELADLTATRLLQGEEPAGLAEVADLFALIGISGSSGMEIPREEIAALRDALFGGAGLVPAAEEMPAGGVHAWPLDVLFRLAEAVAAGCGPALLLLDLESDPHAVDAVTEVVHRELCLYNRSRLDLGGGLFEYLMAPADFAAFLRRLAESDPDRRCLRSVRPTGAEAEPGPEALPASAAAPEPPPVAAEPAPALQASPPASPPPPAPPHAPPAGPARVRAAG